MRTFALKDNQVPKSRVPSPSSSRVSPAGQSRSKRPIFSLQRFVGHEGVRQLPSHQTVKAQEGSTAISPLSARPDPARIQAHPDACSHLQAKLKVNTPGDRYEQEADRIAGEVMAMPGRALWREGSSRHEDCPTCPAEQAGQLSPPIATVGNGTDGASETFAPLTAPGVLRGPGQPLNGLARRFFEPRFGRDLSQVRVHTDPLAAEASRALNARAFTVGRHVFFGAGEYGPENSGGQRLIAHELAHTLQQAHSAVQIQRSNGSPGVSHFSVYNPGDFHWPLLSANRQPEMQAYSAGSIIRGTRYNDYDGWTPAAASFHFELEEAGARVDVRAGAEVGGVQRSTGAGTYVKDAWVEATATPGSAFIDAEVGWSRPFRWVRARWDFQVHDAAAVELPVEIRVQHAGRTTIAQRIIRFFGDGSTEMDFSRTPTTR